jgi:ribosomal protein S18 acetylase RimI-like enzyme
MGVLNGSTVQGALHECWDWERVAVFQHGVRDFFECGQLRGVRFEPVEFFRRGWGLRTDNTGDWPALFDFLGRGGRGFRVDVPDDAGVVSALGTALPGANLSYSDVQVRWMDRSGVDLEKATVLREGLTAERASLGDMRAFAEIYLRCFGAMPADWDAAVENVMAYGEIPGWEGWMVWGGGKPVAGYGLFVRDGVAFLSSAATLPEYRRCGIQRGMIARRVLRSLELGAGRIETYAHEGGTSLKNLLGLGFERESLRHTFTQPPRSGGVA